MKKIVIAAIKGEPITESMLADHVSELLRTVIRGQPISDNMIERELYDICDKTHSSCDGDCPVYRANGNEVPTAVTGKWYDCSCFKDGKKMLRFLRKANKEGLL